MKFAFHPLRSVIRAAQKLAGGVALTSLLQADVLVYEPFDYPLDASLTGLSGGSGWDGAWTQDGLTGDIDAPGLSYADAVGNILDVAGLAMNTANTATTRNFRKMTGGPLNEVWLSFLYQIPASNTKFEGVTLYRGVTQLFAISNESTSLGAAIRFENLAGPGTVSLSKGQFGTTHLIVLKLSRGSANNGNDQIEIHVDPILSIVPSQPDAVIHHTDFSFDTLRIAGQDGASLLVDELRIGTSFADVSPHQPSESGDSDGDGLTDDQERILGLDPAVSQAALIQAIRRHPSYFGLLSQTDVVNDVSGGWIGRGSGNGIVDIIFELQTSTDLDHWRAVETISRSIELPEGKNFLRLSADTD